MLVSIGNEYIFRFMHEDAIIDVRVMLVDV